MTAHLTLIVDNSDNSDNLDNTGNTGNSARKAGSPARDSLLRQASGDRHGVHQLWRPRPASRFAQHPSMRSFSHLSSLYPSLPSSLTAPSRLSARSLTAQLRDTRGAVTAEYAVVIVAAVAFAGLLVAIMRSGEIRQMLVDLVQSALGSAG